MAGRKSNLFRQGVGDLDADMKTPPTVSLVRELVSISKSVRALMGIKLAEIGLFPGQDELLLALPPDTGMPVALLADRLGVRSSTVSKMVDQLTAAEYVERAPAPRDARRTIIRITPIAAAMQGRIKEVWRSVEHEFHGMQDLERVERDLRLIQEVLAIRLNMRR